MRKIQNIAFVLLATLLAGCINDHIENHFCRDGVLTLNLSTSAVGTRADGPMDDGGDSYHPEESTIYDIQLFLYPADSKESTPAVFAKKIDVTAAEKPNHDTTTITEVSIPAGAISDLFSENETCDIYVIVNYETHMGEDLTDGYTDDTSSREYLKSRPLYTEFVEINEFGEVWAPQAFVMDSDTYTVTRNDDNTLSCEETIYVTRAAAKIAIEICVESFTDAEGNKWEALTDVKEGTERYITLDFFNGVRQGIINDNSDTVPTGKDIVGTIVKESTYYNVSNLELLPGGLSNDIQPPVQDSEGSEGTEGAEGTEDATSAVKYFVPEARLYSYTTAWGDKDSNGNSTEGDVTNSDETYDPNADAPHFKLSIPWKKTNQNSESWVTYDYTVPIGLNLNQLVRNKLYVIRLHVSALGDLNLLDESVYSYKVCDWEDVSFEAELTRPKYFVVEEEYVEIYNKDSYSVNFSASDIVSAEIISIIKPDYSERKPIEDNYIYGGKDSTTGEATVNGSSLKADRKNNKGNVNSFTLDIDNDTDDGDGKSITLSHTLDNDMTSTGFDYVPYTVKVKATMTITDSAGNETYMVKDITFKQYPEMYISADLNSDYDNDSDVNGNRGYAWVNNSYNTLGSLNGFSTGNSNSNPSMITITTTALKGSDFVIGDPRSIDVNNLGYSQFVSAPSVQGNTRSLSYYYPTRSTDEAKSIISPKFRIASSYGLTSSISITNARYRCASYQEDGYPAGRWRIPTAAEIKYIVTLSARGFITILFNDDGNYWAANGYIYVPDYDNGGSVTQTTGSSAYVRCVYDEWYWGSEPIADKTKFTWGDEPRQ